MKDLAWGYNGSETRSLPEGTLRWGARAILGSGSLDIVADRTSFSESWEQPQRDWLLMPLVGKLNVILGVVKTLWQCGRLRQDSDEVFVLFEDDVLKVIGSANRSYGYFYLTAWLKNTPDNLIAILNRKPCTEAVELRGTLENWTAELSKAAKE